MAMAIVDGAILRFAILSDADLTGANLTEASMYKADLTGANLAEADLSGVIGLPDFSGALNVAPKYLKD